MGNYLFINRSSAVTPSRHEQVSSSAHIASNVDRQSSSNTVTESTSTALVKPTPNPKVRKASDPQVSAEAAGSKPSQLSSNTTTQRKLVPPIMPTTNPTVVQSMRKVIGATPKQCSAAPKQNASAAKDAKYTVFISHAGEDKATIAIPLREKLAEQGISAFVDEKDMRVGTIADEAMTVAMKTAKVAVIVVSPEFVAREWPMKELMCFQSRCEEEGEDGENPVIIPFFYRLSVGELYREPRFDRMCSDGESLYLKSRFLERMSAGEPEANIEKVKEALRKLHRIMGLRNDLDATNDSPHEMSRKREFLLTELCSKVSEVAASEESIHAEAESASQETETNQIVEDKFCKAFPSSFYDVQALLDFDSQDEKGNPRTAEGLMKDHLLRETDKTGNVVAIHGIGGVGKSTILQALAIDKDIRKKFSDGVHILRLGQDATKATLFERICRVLKSSGAEKMEESLRIRNDIDDALEEFERWFEGRRCAFLIDDAWVGEIGIGAFSRLIKMGDAKRGNVVLITTREHEIASLAPSIRIIRLKPREANGEESRKILFFHADHEERECMSRCANDAIKEILRICDGLPVGLCAAGKNVKKMKIDIGEDEEVWKLYLSHLGAFRDRLWRMNVDNYGNLFATFATSLSFLDEKRSEDIGFETKLSFSEMHRRLCVLQKQDTMPATTLKYLWNTESVDQAQVIATIFVEMGLASREAVIVGNDRVWGVSLHDSVHDFTVFEAERNGETKEAHESLLAGYSTCNAQLSSAQGRTTKWWCRGLKEDGYIHRNLCRHLLGAGRGRELVRLLMIPGWTERQLKVNGILMLETDFSLGIRASQEETSDVIVMRIDDEFEVKKTLELICEATKLSWTFVAENHRELWFQVYGRLIGLATRFKGIKVYLNKVGKEAKGPWLRSLSCFLMEPGGTNVRIIPLGVWVNCIVLMGDGERVACGCFDGRIFIVNVKQGEVEKNWKAHDYEVTDITIGRKGMRLVSCSLDGTAKVWDMKSRRCVATFKGHTDCVTCVAVMKDGVRVVSGSRDCTAQVWDMETGQVLSKRFRDHKRSVLCVSMVGYEDYIVTGGEDYKLRLWSASSGTQVGGPLVGHEETVTNVTVTADGSRIVSGSLDGCVRIWGVESRRQIGEPFKGYYGTTIWDVSSSIAVSKNERRIAYGSDDNKILVWDVMSRNEVCTPLEGHTDCVTGVSFLNNFESVVSCSSDGCVRVWDVRRENVERIGSRHDRAVRSLSFTPDGKYLVSGSYDKTLRVWDATSRKQVGNPLLGHQMSITGVSVTRDGSRIVSVSWDETVRVWDLQSRELLVSLTGHTNAIWCVAVTPNGNSALTGSMDKTVRIWDLNAMNGSHVVLRGHSAPVARVFVSDDGKRTISVDSEGTVFIWELETGQSVKKVCDESALRLSREDVMNLVGEPKIDGDAVPSIWFRDDRITYREAHRELILGTMETGVECLAISPDKKTVCVGLDDGQVAFIELEKVGGQKAEDVDHPP